MNFTVWEKSWSLPIISPFDHGSRLKEKEKRPSCDAVYSCCFQTPRAPLSGSIREGVGGILNLGMGSKRGPGGLRVQNFLGSRKRFASIV